jgi:hypothetical protein
MNTTTHTTLNTLAHTLEGLALSLAAEGFAASHPLAVAVQQAQAQQAALKIDLAGFAQRTADELCTVAKALKEAYRDSAYSGLPAMAAQVLHTGAKVDGLNMACGGHAYVGGLSEWMTEGDIALRVILADGSAVAQEIGGAA